MHRRVLLTLLASLPVFGVLQNRTRACGAESAAASAAEAMGIFVGALMVHGQGMFFRIVSYEKPFAIRHGGAVAEGTSESEAADAAKQAALVNGMIDCLFDKNSMVAGIVAATGGKDWTEAGAGRFVPPGSNDDSAVFVSFREEWDGWYLDAIGLPVG